MDDVANHHDDQSRHENRAHLTECFPRKIEFLGDVIQHFNWFFFPFQSEPQTRESDEIEGDENFPKMDNQPI